jgi:hypothetical protein
MTQVAESSIRPGLFLEGTGTHRVQVVVVRIEGKRALCRLVRSGGEKWIALKTLSTAYRGIDR